jgi:hypothetical protein
MVTDAPITPASKAMTRMMSVRIVLGGFIEMLAF